MALTGNVNLDTAITVSDFIALRASDEITYYNYSVLEYLNGFDMFITNILYDYDDELQEAAITIKLSEKEQAKYKYKPWLLAFDLYGSTEAKFILMMLNNIIDPKEFTFEKIKAIKIGDLIQILSRIQIVNSEFMNINRTKLQNDFKNNDGNNIW